MNKLINLFLALLFIIPVVGQAQITTDRQDGRFQSTRGTVQYMLKQMKPAYALHLLSLKNGNPVCVQQ